MAKTKQISLSVIRISKAPSYKGLKIILFGIDEKRTEKFNNFKQIEITEEELTAIGEHRWLIKEN